MARSSSPDIPVSTWRDRVVGYRPPTPQTFAPLALYLVEIMPMQ